MSLFKTTYNYTVNNDKFDRLKSKSNNNLSEVLIPVNIGKAGDQRIETGITWVKTKDNQIKLTITSNVEKLNIGIIIGIIFVTLFTGYMYSAIASFFLLIIVFFPVAMISISATKSKVQNQTIEYLKNI